MRGTLPAALLALAGPAAANSAWNWDIIHYGIIDGFKWSRPWPEDGSPLNGFIIPCKNHATFHATQFKASELHTSPPDGLAPWANQLHGLFESRSYPGSWDGVNLHGEKRDLVLMEYQDVPVAVRDWVEKELKDEVGQKKRFMGIFRKPKAEERHVLPEDISELPPKEKVLIIAPGELYEILPLFVSKGSQCEGDLGNLEKYHPQAVDKGVVAWPTEHPLGLEGPRHDINFTIEAWSVIETEEGRANRIFWEKAHRMFARQHRKQMREDREGKREEVGDVRGKDEL